MKPTKMQLLLIATMAIWGLNISALKVLTAYFDPLIISCIRMVLAAFFINCILIWSRRPIKLQDITRGQWLRFLLCAALMVYANQLFFTNGLQSASASNSSLIMALSPLVASILAAVIFREPLTRVRLLGVALGFGGVFAVVFSSPGASLSGPEWGDLQVFGAMFTFVTGGILIQGLARHFNALVISSIIYTLGGGLRPLAAWRVIHLMALSRITGHCAWDVSRYSAPARLAKQQSDSTWLTKTVNIQVLHSWKTIQYYFFRRLLDTRCLG